MLLSEMLLIEAFENERHLIFDDIPLVNAAKKCFITASVTCHALDIKREDDDKTYKLTASKEAHEKAVEAVLFPELCKYNAEISLRNANKKSIIEDKHIDEIQRERKLKAWQEQLNNFKSSCIIPAVYNRTDLVKNLYPYSINDVDKSIACIYIDDETGDKHKIVVKIHKNLIVTAYKFNAADILNRAIEFVSLELLALDKYSTLDVSDAQIYAAINTIDAPAIMTNAKKEALFTKLMNKCGIAPQEKQQAFRKFEAELAQKALEEIDKL